MAQSVNLLVPAFVLLVLVQGARSSEKCGQGAAGLEVLQTSNGDKAGVDTVFEVTVRNPCACAVRGVFLRSEGFMSSIPVDAKLFRREGNDYLVADGGRIESGGEVRFQYAWERPFNITPAAVQDDCSGGVHQFTL
ncbi:unnamed protein product [Miscanthus lutarioriparius]|uniref:Uncharacterized protein n=1 Tax=Miscanthus lutarioriparius TaxID=422564 RepID=A0A811QF74_9POAL|nr:unnamed protein product [Miscanthus lutarioriparius]